VMTPKSGQGLRKLGSISAVLLTACVLFAQTSPPPVTLKVEIVNAKAGKKSASAGGEGDASNVVVWLIPNGAGPGTVSASPTARPMPQIAQINKSFDPHVLVIQVGTEVRFPNKDPFLHNVFSLFDGKRFDLGFYEAGSSKTVHFDRAGVSFLFCNIHPEMSAAVIAVDTPYFGSSDRTGRVSIPNVPDGRYQLNVWYERSLPEDLKSISRGVTISDATRSLEPIRVVENPNFSLEHKNKYGQDYVPPPNTGPTYGHP
jgi:plastocyanin